MNTAIPLDLAGPVVYLYHFAEPIGNLANSRAMAQHYLGWTPNLAARDAMHRAGRGAAITRYAVEQGIAFELIAVWPGDYQLEKRIKAVKAGPRLCPKCGARHRYGPYHIPGAWLQLPLALDPDPLDLAAEAPAPRPGRDGYEFLIRRAWRLASAPRPDTGVASTPSALDLAPAEPWHIAF